MTLSGQIVISNRRFERHYYGHFVMESMCLGMKSSLIIGEVV